MVATVALVPLKRFESAKGRLADVLAHGERQRLMRDLAAAVLGALPPLPTRVVCDVDTVASFALERGADVVWRGGGLNAAVQGAAAQLERDGFGRVIVVHGDLATPGGFERFLSDDPDRVIAAGDDRSDGTNVLSVPLGRAYRFAYGPGSLAAHRTEAERLGLEWVVSNAPDLALDLDTPQDLRVMNSRRDAPPTATGAGDPVRR